MFNVGDQVEIIGTDYEPLRKSVGMIGDIIRVDPEDYLVQLPRIVNGDNKWFYLEKHLKEAEGL